MIKNEQGLKHDEVVNGIAFNKRKNTLLLTGKNWAHFYEISLS